MPKLKALQKDEDLAAVPLDQPVLVQLPEFAETPDREEGDVPEPRKPALKVVDRDEDPGVTALKEQMEALRTANAADIARERETARKATERAAEAERVAREARTETADAETSAVETGLSSAQRERDGAKLAYKNAMESGDFGAAADAQERLARSASDIREYERAAAALAERKTEADRLAKEPQRQPVNMDVAAGIDANPNLMPTEREWLKAHQDAVVDSSRNQELGVAYTRATRAGHVRGTPDYFTYIEEFMGYKKPAAASREEDDDMPVQAPVSRTERGSDGRPSQGRVTLTPEQREIAKSMNLTDIEYARQVVAFDQARKADPEKYR